uniref:RNA-editing substrate-binding complex 6 protein domain-containing protein n=1 Tax=Chromera velia CCMP2878 TaxID=1169474 RepID=A0A0G4F1C6_9ALVE|mmetsp:Transcript_34998/g.69086  ORF Transcript_34998/g.69086 Transcript_34998/m.69086 type:complete len:542 (-) Transcript_34998:116-1741(-)|eukprot:Cvel_14700.t1-p1 / transcript=Cvel_14700.t1 / gene=Cvel_14700 / organism=Chromera_velia_CCMP2878 / gene_product=hypothetical protein / transcript_product=hypothetical protein / location=Cvel_scaffold1055:34903-41534(-) / protein_length=541 / sequence_SO=supercontig / SO=protein_coding / is_pseudo=false
MSFTTSCLLRPVCTLTRKSAVSFLPPCAVSPSLVSFSRCLHDSVDRINAVRELERPADVLQFFALNSDMDTETLEATLRSLARKANNERETSKALMNDEKFQRLVAAVAGRLEDADARLLARIASAAAIFPFRSPELLDLGQRVAEVSSRRENAFSSRHLASLSFGLAVLGIRDPALVEFVRLETLKTIHDFGPRDLHTLLEALRQWHFFNRELLDLICEKMVDEVNRFTSRDVVDTLRVLSLTGLARGFLIRRLSSLAFEALEQFTPPQLIRVAYSLARLRFLTVQNLEEVLDALAPHIGSLGPVQTADLLHTMAMLDYGENEELLGKLVDQFASQQCRSILPLVDFLHAMCVFELYKENPEAFKTALQRVLSSPVTKNRMVLMKLSEVLSCYEVEELRERLPRVEIPSLWRGACDECDRLEQEKTESLKMFAEVAMVTDLLRGKFKLPWTRNARRGPYYLDFLDEETGIVLEVDAVSRPVTRALKHRNLKALGLKPVSMGYWQWRRARSEDDQILLLKAKLEEPLVDVGRLERLEESGQ